MCISGPPARLAVLLRTADFFRNRQLIALPVYGGPCHAKHLYTENDVNKVVSTRSMDKLDGGFSPRFRVMSTSTGRPFAAASAGGLFKAIINEILTQPIQLDAVNQGLVQLATNSGTTQCKLLVCRISQQINGLITTLKELADVETSTEEVMSSIRHKSATSDEGGPRTPMQSKIAIVGMSCRMPGGANDTEKFWELLRQGLDVHKKVPADRFNTDTHCDPCGQRLNTSLTPFGCFIDEPGLFDPAFFNMSPREAQQTDPQQRLALVTAYEALERAGFVANRTNSTNLHRIGTFYGQTSDDYREVNISQEISTYFIPGGCRAFGPGRINYFFKFSGPSYSIDTACSSSLASIQVRGGSFTN